jgi:hypothetical protein
VSKRIILLLDGTWNDADIGATDTNIVRLRDLIAKTLGHQKTTRVEPAMATETGRKLVHGFASSDGRENIVFYERGVGTSAFDRLRGGIFGQGLGVNVRSAYKFLSYFYEEGDQIFVFGFSRGAYTARSLVGYLNATGLLQRRYCSAELELKAWSYYRTSPNARLPGIWTELTPYVHWRDKFRVECVAVFDTVGALGVPLEPFWRANRDRYAFHNVELCSITNLNLHAVAIDEHRKPFQATIWRKPPFKQFATTTEQVWFVGSHGDVGGSYIPEEQREVEFPQSLDDISLDWMIKRLLHYYRDFPLDVEKQWKRVSSSWSRAAQHDSRTLPYWIYPKAFRSIANLAVAGVLPWQEVCRDRHAHPIAEMVHVSAIERLGQVTRLGKRSRRYLPANLLAALPEIRRTYKLGKADAHARDTDILLVGWDGNVLDPNGEKDRAVAADLMRAAEDHLYSSAKTS